MTITVRHTTSEEQATNMPYLTASMLEALVTCPRWGLINSVNRRSFTENARSMALEAGSTMHEVFSVLNLLQVGLVQGKVEHMNYHGNVLFPGRWAGITAKLDPLQHDKRSADIIEDVLLRCLASSEFYDDPGDQFRTMSNLERAAFELYNYWVNVLSEFTIETNTLPEEPIGVERSIDVVLMSEGHKPIRFIGLADAVYRNAETKKVTLGEYKTSSRVTDSYLESFQTRNQISAYLLGLHADYSDYMTGNAIIIASEMPPKATKQNVQHIMVSRDVDSYESFFTACQFGMQLIDQFGNAPTDAPMFTHSCNRYFRTCSLMSMCTCTAQDRRETYDSMFTMELSPSEQMAELKRG